MTPDPMVLLDLIGLRPVVVEWLDDDAVIVTGRRIILVRPHADLDWVADWALSEAAAGLAAEPSP